MIIAVCIKQTPDTEARIEIAADGLHVVERDLAWIISPHDEAAIEQALVLKDAHGGQVNILSLGPERVESAIREALAMGADSGMRLTCEGMPADPAATAWALAAQLGPGICDLILMGEQSIDGEGAQTPQRVAAILGLPCVTAVERLKIDGDEAEARRPLEGMEETVRFRLPAVVAVNRRLGEPRYPTIRGIMQAKKRKIIVKPADLGASGLVIDRLHAPARKAAGRVFEYEPGVTEQVVHLLREEAKVI